MPRPTIVRADTLDLQPEQHPSAQDHTNAPDSPRGALGVSPHQNQAIRNVEQERMEIEHPDVVDEVRERKNSNATDDEELEDAEIAGDEGGFDDDDDMMDKMSSSPSIIDEDIDFEMVYALHTFNATVEGQANAGKGEHMVLLDDSNSYWWLVRIIRDGSIGYLPAEHIETPTERLARLNKHRNIDLSANMLSDSSPGTKNPIKKLARRRHAKNVQFGEPRYIEASDYEYTTDEEEGEDGFLTDDEEGAADTEEEPAEKSSTNGTAARSTPTNEDKNRATITAVQASPDSRTSEDGSDGVRLRPNPRPAELRHPDSAIFRDEDRETKKLTLTPSLLRGEESVSSTKPEVIRGRASLEHRDSKEKTRDNILSPPPGDRGRLKKGGSVLGNLFKKRSKRGKKEIEEEVDEFLHGGGEKRSLDSKDSIDSTRDSTSSRTDEKKEAAAAAAALAAAEEEKKRQADQERKKAQEKEAEKQRQLQEQKRKEQAELQRQDSERKAREQAQIAQEQREQQQREREVAQKLAAQEEQARREQERQQELEQQQKAAQQQQQKAAAEKAAAAASSLAAASTIRRVQTTPDPEEMLSSSPVQGRNSPQVRPTELAPAPVREPKTRTFDTQPEPKTRSPITPGPPSPNPQAAAPQPQRQVSGEKPAYAPTSYKPAAYQPAAYTPARQVSGGSAGPSPITREPPISPAAREPELQRTLSPEPEHERLSESPEHITFHDATERPELVVDTSSGSSPARSSPMESSPEMIERMDSSADEGARVGAGANGSAKTLAPQRSWSDWSLRTYFEDDNDVRDMLIVVQQDKGEAGLTKEHPDIVPIYEDSTRRLQDITKRLDGMLGDWIQRRGTRSTPVSVASS